MGVGASVDSRPLPLHLRKPLDRSNGDCAVALLGLLDTDEQEVVRFLRLTGWRVEEPLGLTWDQVDREGEVLRLYAHETKGKAGRVFPFALAPELKALLDGRWEKRNGPFVFHKDGNRIAYTTLHKHWKKACKSAGLAGRLIHDLRRTAAREMRRAGLSEGEIMKLCGGRRERCSTATTSSTKPIWLRRWRNASIAQLWHNPPFLPSPPLAKFNGRNARRRSQVVRQRSAKPLFVGSIPTGASSPYNDLRPLLGGIFDSWGTDWGTTLLR